MSTPRLEINLYKIAHNIKTLISVYGRKDISITAVTKVVCGNISVAEVLVKEGIRLLADSKIKNLKKMAEAGIKGQYLLLGPPKLSEAREVVKHTDISLNTELSVIHALSNSAIEQDLIHRIILMVEYGDLREGIMPDDLEETIVQLLQWEGIELIGLGTNLACLCGVEPDKDKMESLSALATSLEKKFKLNFELISGGNSANFNWFSTLSESTRINNLRIGESIFLGRETLERKRIPELYIDAFTLVAEVIEIKKKPSLPYGKVGQNAFAETPQYSDNGIGLRVILGMGIQDVPISGLEPEEEIEILGGGSDHIIVNPQKTKLKVGDEVRFNLSYAGLLAAMTSPYVTKVNI